MKTWHRLLTDTRLRYSLSPLALFCFNAWLCLPLFRLDYSARMESAEASFISISSQMVSHWRDFSWWPLWYDGIPGVQTYPPLLHVIVAGVSAALGISVAHAHHVVTACFYCLGPVALYILCLTLTQSWSRAVWVGIAYSLISPTAFFVPWVRTEIGGALRPWRICTLVLNGDGPHIAALAIIPLALAALHKFLEGRRPPFFVLTVVGFAAVAATNWIGAFTLAGSVLIYLFAATDGTVSSVSRWLWTVAAAIFAYGLALPWLPPSAIALIPANSAWLGEDERSAAAQMPGRVLALLALVCLLLLAAKWKHLSSTRQFAFSWCITFAALPILAEWLKFSIVIQPHRYQLELDLTFCFLIVLLVYDAMEKFQRWKRAVFLIAGCVVVMQAVTWKLFISALIQPVNIERTIEYRVAHWLGGHVGDGRAYATGSISFWMAAFSDVPQMGGGADQGLPTETLRTAFRTIYGHPMAPPDPDGSLALLWLRAYGVDLAVVGGPGSLEYFKLYRNPQKFERIAKNIWHVGDDAIYEVPRRSRSLAHVVSFTDTVQHSPAAGDDVVEVRRYVNATESDEFPAAAFHWTDRHQATIDAVVRKNQVVSVQMEYHDGWHAFVEGRERPVRADGLGLITVQPNCDGRCHIRLVFDGGPAARYALLASGATSALLFCFVLLTMGFRRNAGTSLLSTVST